MKYENRVWIFLFENAVERSDEQYKKDSKESMELNLVASGVKGICWLSYNLDIPSGLIVDYMHLVLEGTLKKILNLWLQSSNHGSRFYLGLYFLFFSMKLLN